MKCPNCGGQMGLEDAFCPYCGTRNEQAAKHQSDMAHFRQEYERTQADVMQKTSLMQRHGSWLVILSVLLVALVAGIVLNVFAWDIGYSIRTGSAESSRSEDSQVMDAFLEKGDYGQFVGYYNANDISYDYDNSYQALRTAANAYVYLVQDIAEVNDRSRRSTSSEHLSFLYSSMAESLNRIYTIEQQYSYDIDRYLPSDKRKYVDDIRERAAAISKAYLGLTDEDLQEIPNMSTRKLAKIIEEGVAS